LDVSVGASLALLRPFPGAGRISELFFDGDIQWLWRPILETILA
jgi:hypothetical protein